MAKGGGGGGGGGAGGGAGGGGDNSMAVVWVMVLLFITVYLIWVYAHRYIVSFVFQVNLVQAEVVNFFIHNAVLSRHIYLMKTIDPGSVQWQQLVDITRSVGEFTRYPVAVSLVVMAIVLYHSNIVLKYRKTHDMNTLRAQEQANWSAIMPVVKEDLISQDVNKGPWAMALTPMEFARKFDLLRKDDVLLDNQTPGLEMTAGIRRGDAKRVFTMQLGPYWQDFDRLPPQAYALAAVFLARMNREKDAAMEILSHLNKTFVQGQIDYSVAKPIIKKYRNAELVQEVVAQHAYMLSVMGSLLVAAREDGVVPSAEFLWLKLVDRRLWYMLNSMGRQTPFAEVGGPFAHWRAEKAMGRRCLVPMIDEAIKALEEAVKGVKLTPRQMQELKP